MSRTHPLAAAILSLALSFAAPDCSASPPRDLDWAEGAVMYEVFVRSFADSDGDGIGDLNGLTAKLDYLNDGDSTTTRDLGVDGIWLMPIFPSPSYHGYDVTDYEHVNPDYGTDADFDRLLSEAHRRGIRVIIDLVLNHTSDHHPWFLDSASGPGSPRRDWYVWSPEDRHWGQPWNPLGTAWHRIRGAYYYGLFWSGMPDLNFRTSAVQDEMERIAELWLDRGVDGFRLDATRHLVETGPGDGQSDTPETHSFLREFAERVNRAKPDALLVGENWTDAAAIATYFGSGDSASWGDELPCNFDFPLAAAIVEGVGSGDGRGIAAVLREVKRLYPPGAIDAPFLTNHDMVRVATRLESKPGRLRSAASLLLSLPGTPFLYYGEEAGLENGRGDDDRFKRTPMPWDGSNGGGFTRGTPWFGFAPGRERANVAIEDTIPSSLLSRYRDLIRARRQDLVLRRGRLEEVLTPEEHPTPALAFTRRLGAKRLLIVHNLGDGVVSAGPYAVEAPALRPIFVDAGVRASSSGAAGVTVTLPPHAVGIWRID
jgi:glycosidase